MEQTLHTRQELVNNLNKIIIRREYDNKQLRRSINEVFDSKGLNLEKIKAVFDQLVGLDTFTNIELIALYKACESLLKPKKILLENYFSSAELTDYELATTTAREHEAVLTYMEFNKMIEIDYATYLGRISHEQIYKYMNNNLLYYNFNTQRQTTVSQLGTIGGYIAQPTLNKKSVEDMAQLIYDNEFDENEIIFNVRLIDGKEDPNVQRSYPMEGICNLIITPNLDIEDEHCTIVDILDGFHRMRASLMASQMSLEKEGTFPQGGFDLRIVMKGETDAKRIVKQTFKRSDTGKEHLDSLTVDDYSIMVDNIIKNCKILNNRVANSYNDMLVEGKWTYKTGLKKVIRESSGLDASKMTIRQLTAQKIGSKLNELLSYFIEQYYDNDINQFTKSIFGNCHMFMGYLASACVLEKLNSTDYISVAEAIYDMSEETISSLNIKKKRCNINDIYNLFKAITLEVVR